MMTLSLKFSVSGVAGVAGLPAQRIYTGKLGSEGPYLFLASTLNV